MSEPDPGSVNRTEDYEDAGQSDTQANLDFDWDGKTVASDGQWHAADVGNEPSTVTGKERYRLIEKVGSGTYGVVYRANDEVLQRVVALKLLTRFDSATQVDAWLREARVLASLDHRAIVPVYDIGKTRSGQPYIVSKFVDGGTLSNRIARGNLNVDDTTRMIVQLADALAYLHERSVMHRDIKPGNILTTSEGDAVLADFGLAMHESTFGRGARFIGTPAYMSPEQARYEGHRVDGRSDIYSLGVVFYQLLTGVRPFMAKDQEELLDCIRNLEVRPLRQLNASLPRELERICLKALAKKASERYSTAADFALDLREFMASSSTGATVTVSVADSEQETKPTVAESVSVGRSHELNYISVVPHGLRAFGADDADFFQSLLPGAKDRYGVPESVSFWTHRISNRDASDTFRVGVLLGPSGSGKSSLMRAAVLPQVQSEVDTIYVEAKPQNLEEALLTQLRRVLPQLDPTASLRESLTLFRQQQADQPGRKLCIVIDQFEQWLNFHRDDETTELHDALRQCDGGNLQAILLVRDDFMIGLTSFMDQLEELLLQSQNFATMEPFSTQHAARVLTSFGRAYGAVQGEPTAEQAAFVQEAVNDLARAGALVPVQLCLLSEMIKDKPWTRATLKQLGGTQGLGVSFLEERLRGKSAHPLLRTHSDAVSRILQELLPVDDAVIKPPACPQHILLERLEGVANASLLQKLMQLLDTEVRLITPASGKSTGSIGNSSTSDPAYQFAHDFLVPTTRKWLSLQDGGSRSGRVRQQLREMSAAWNAAPSPKKLPSLFEWLTIRWFISKSEWTPPIRLMMRSTQRRLAIATAGIAAVSVGVGFMGYNAFARAQGRLLASRLIDADTANVATVLQDIEPYRRWVEPQLEQLELPALQADASGPVTLQSQQRTLHKALAQFDQRPSQADYVLGRLGDIDDRNLGSIIEFLKDRKSLEDARLLEKMQQAVSDHSPNALPLAALVAARGRDDAIFDRLAPQLCEILLEKRATQLSYWTAMLDSVRGRLLPALIVRGNSVESDSPTVEKLVTLIGSFARDDASHLAQTVAWTPLRQLPSLLADARVDMKLLAVELRQQLSDSRLADSRTGWATTSTAGQELVPAATLKQLQDYDGQVFANCAWAEQVPWRDVEALLIQMQSSNYAPVSVRPYAKNDDRLATIAWERLATESKFESELTEAQLLDKFDAYRGEGLELIDFSVQPSEKNATTAERLWSAVWLRTDRDIRSHQLLLALNATEHSAATSGLGGYVTLRHSVNLDDQGNKLFSTLWEKSDLENGELNAIADTRLANAFGDLYPGNCMTDFRCEDTLPTRDRGNNWNNYYYFLERTRTANRTTRTENQLKSTRWLSAAGDQSGTLETLDRLLESGVSETADSLSQRALANARLGNSDELEALIERLREYDDHNAIEMVYLELRHAVLVQDEQKSVDRLDYLRQNADKLSGYEKYFLRALATFAAANFESSLVADAYAELLDRVPVAMASGRHSDFGSTLLEVDFDVLRDRVEWRELLRSRQLNLRYAVASHYDPEQESRFLTARPLGEHRRDSELLQQQGFVPVAVQRVDDGTERSAASLWRREKLPDAQLALAALRKARLVLALSQLGEQDALLDGLDGKWGRDVRTYLMTQSKSLLKTEPLVAALRTNASIDVQNAIVLTLGGYSQGDFTEADWRYAKLRIGDWASEADEARLSNAARWCMQRWGETPTRLPPQPLSKNRDWYVNGIGLQMIVFHPPETVLIGRPDQGADCRWVKLGQSFALSATEVTREQYADFLRDPRMQTWMERKPLERRQAIEGSSPLPQTASWQHAVRFCQWLNQQEDVPESQWCYLNVWSEKPADIALAPDYLQRTGYRLASNAEFEWACGSDSDGPWHWGHDPLAYGAFEWAAPQSSDRLQPVAQLRPNAFGLFDMAANAAEWCDTTYRPPYRPADGYAIDNVGNSEFPQSNTLCVRRDGRYNASVETARTNAIKLYASEYLSSTSGFRVARTIGAD